MHIFTSMTRRIAPIFAAIVLALPMSATAQNMFAPAVTINDTVITNYELRQRETLLTALRTPGDIQELALERLINERLQLAAAKRAGISITPDQVEAGIAEFAGRANLEPEQFLATLTSAGVAPESFRDFVTAGLAWRDHVRAKFGPKAQISDGEITNAIANTDTQPGDFSTARVLISELFLPADNPQVIAESEAIATRVKRITTLDGFAAAAREYSIGLSAPRGGRVETWVPLSNLPAPITQSFLTMNVGEVSDPFPLENAVVMFQLRALQEVPAEATEITSIDYAAYYIPGGNSEKAHDAARKLRAKVDVCDDLFGIAKNQPPEVLDRNSLPVSEIPQDVAIELAKLDVGESSTALTRADGQTLVFLMLCSRETGASAETSREVVQQRLFNQRLTSLAEGYLSELKADAIITFP